MKFSLSTRISLVVVCLWTMMIVIAGLFLHRVIYRELKEESVIRLNLYIAEIESAIYIEDGKLNLKPTKKLSSDSWQVTTQNGRVLWNTHWAESQTSSLTRSKKIELGSLEQPVAREALIEELKTEGRVSYRLPAPDARIQLRVDARVPTTHIDKELARLTIALWTVGPLVGILFFGVMFLFIRWQLHPLRRITQQAAAIGPENVSISISPAGTSSECVTLRDSLNRMLQRLALGLERERNFSACAAHEMRTPLAQLRTQIEVGLRKPRTAEKYKEILEKCFLDVERLEKLIVSLLMLSRDARDNGMNQTQSLVTVLKAACRDSGNEGLIEQPSVASLTGIHVIGNTEFLTSALRNIFENARKYSRSTPTIEVRQIEGMIQIEIADTGPGIPPEERERIFDPLVRLDAARSINTASDGFGLGLTIARMSVRACGGELSCTGRSDGKSGAVFVCRLRPA